MNSQTRYFFLDGGAGRIECALDLPNEAQFAAPDGDRKRWWEQRRRGGDPGRLRSRGAELRRWRLPG